MPSIRKNQFAVGEYYHVFNRGVEKRDIFSNADDLTRFYLSMQYFNSVEPIGSIYAQTFGAEQNNSPLRGFTPKSPPLVTIIAYCLNPNHYHLILTQRIEKGISEFMKRLGGGYTTYFNDKYKRSGSLFQGVFKSVHISSNEQLLHVSAYVNLNNRLRGETPKLSRTSWDEYVKGRQGICEGTAVILKQFNSPSDYQEYAEKSLDDIIERKQREKELQTLLIE